MVSTQIFNFATVFNSDINKKNSVLPSQELMTFLKYIKIENCYFKL